jgi:phosphatidylinositol alpha-1,6-mannosyltransferase
VSRIAFRFAHRVVANGASTARSLSEQDGVAAARVTLIPNFVDDGMFEPPTHEWVAHTRAQLGIPRSAVVGCIVASLRPVKDHPTLFAALPRIREAVPEFVLLVVGDGPARAELEGLARQLGVQESVKFAGVMAQRPSAHHIADVSLLTSRSEGFPNALVEAMAAARPLVGTDVTGIRDVVVPGENGLLVRSGSSDELAAAVVRLLQNSAERKRMGERGLAIAREHYSASVAIKALMTLYDSAVTGHA